MEGGMLWGAGLPLAATALLSFCASFASFCLCSRLAITVFHAAEHHYSSPRLLVYGGRERGFSPPPPYCCLQSHADNLTVLLSLAPNVSLTS